MAEIQSITITNEPEEEWRPVVGYEGVYIVSESGAVMRIKAARGARINHCLKSAISNCGYFVVVLTPPMKMFLVHRIVARAFLGIPPEGEEQVNHKDAIKTNNHYSNLEYVSPQGNSDHAAAHGLVPSGENHWSKHQPEKVHRGSNCHLSKLTEELVREIRNLCPKIHKTKIVAAKYSVSKSTIKLIRNGTIWRHVI